MWQAAFCPAAGSAGTQQHLGAAAAAKLREAERQGRLGDAEFGSDRASRLAAVVRLDQQHERGRMAASQIATELGMRSVGEGAGTWVARAYDEDHRCYRVKALGGFGELPGRDRSGSAKKEAEAFVALVESGGEVEEKVETVEGGRRYAESHPDAVGRFKRHVYSDPIAKVKLAKLRRRHLQACRKRLEEKAALVTRRKKGPQVTRDRAPSSINRDMAMLRAALNRVLAPGGARYRSSLARSVEGNPQC